MMKKLLAMLLAAVMMFTACGTCLAESNTQETMILTDEMLNNASFNWMETETTRAFLIALMTADFMLSMDEAQMNGFTAELMNGKSFVYGNDTVVGSVVPFNGAYVNLLLDMTDGADTLVTTTLDIDMTEEAANAYLEAQGIPHFFVSADLILEALMTLFQ